VLGAVIFITAPTVQPGVGRSRPKKLGLEACLPQGGGQFLAVYGHDTDLF
jgi:hypothetical protein